MTARRVYADNAGTTALSKTALDAMMPYLTESYGNPSAIYSLGREAKKALEGARVKVAAAIGALPEEIYFTGSGTEADNWAIRGAAEKGSKKGKHIITSAIEHHAVSHTLEYLKKQGFEITMLPVDNLGRVSPDDLKNAIRDDTILITIMMANNEIGAIQPVTELGRLAREKGVPFHTDAVQAAGHIPIDVKAMNIDMMSIAGHKFRGPKGVGALYIKKGNYIPPLLYGGGQESKRRSSTENVAGIVGLAAALEEATANMAENMKRVSAMRDRLIAELLKIPFSRLTGDPVNRLPGTASFVFECVEGEAMILTLDNAGICASSGSACSSASLDPSHVLLAIGLAHEVAHGSVRLSISECTTDEDIDYIIATLPPIVEKLRAMSPLWEDRMNGKF
ncbi:cysteine desulfurase [Sporobacter termitidis DSM 10068]|uniref:Cysteine desulfurase IscS n=1 Tax=Sporobacter termitidis DSM 10068 TaxID=1123282 RepID=A0A1M5Z564_9FIRM|nr:cysteine desulfurase NifS [Sporobacter termitidis]SHI19331.1 cysteine desulfurase [Sporobacter termitidis DSM 10068]